MASQWPAIVGTLSGTGFGFASSWLLERSRWRRQRSVRWDEHRQSLYGHFIAAMSAGFSSTVEFSQSVSKISFLPDEGLPPSVQMSFQGLNDALAAVLDIVGTIRVTSSQSVSDSAQEWYEALASLMRLALEQNSIESPAWKSTVDEMGARREDFYREARRELGV